MVMNRVVTIKRIVRLKMRTCNNKLRLPSGRFFYCGELEKINSDGKIEKIMCDKCKAQSAEGAKK